MKLSPLFLGAGCGFFLSGLLLGAFPALWSSYAGLQWFYSLALLTFILAGIFFLSERRKSPL